MADNNMPFSLLSLMVRLRLEQLQDRALKQPVEKLGSYLLVFCFNDELKDPAPLSQLQIMLPQVLQLIQPETWVSRSQRVM